MVSLLVISCLAAAFTPVVTERIQKQNEIPAISQEQNTNSELQNLLKNCRLNEKKDGLICDIPLDSEFAPDNKEKIQTKVNYSKKRDDIRFDNREYGNYQTSTVVKTDKIPNKIINENEQLQNLEEIDLDELIKENFTFE